MAHRDGYTAFVSSGVGKKLATSLGLPQPVPLRRQVPGRPLVDGPVLARRPRRHPSTDRAARRAGRSRRHPGRGGAGVGPPRRCRRRPHGGAGTGRPGVAAGHAGPGPEAARALRPGRRHRSRPRTGRLACAAGRPPGARGHHPLGGQGAARRRHRQPRARRRRVRGRGAGHGRVPAVGALRVRRRTGVPGRRGRGAHGILRPAARREGGSGHRRGPRHRRRHRPRPGARRRHGGVRRRAVRRRGPCGGGQRHRRHGAAGRRHGPGCRPAHPRPRPDPSRRARHRRAQRRHHPRQAARQHRRRPLGLGASTSTSARSCG